MLRNVIPTALFAGFMCLHAPGQAPAAADEEQRQPVEVKSPAPDQTIRDRIAGVFSQVEEFKRIEVRVQSGVVTLTGEVPGPQARNEALALVRRTEGVVIALDRLEATAEVAAQLSPAMAKLHDLGRSLTAKLPMIAISIVVLAFFVILANFLHRREQWFNRLRVSSLGKNLVRRLVRVAVIALGVVLALEILAATAVVGALLGAAGLAGIALGFALKNIIENYLAGILLSTRNPFDIGDVIEIAGRTGKVALLTARDTVLVTLDGNHLRIPNGMVINSELLNFTRNPLRRFEFIVGISVDLDLNEARRVGRLALERNPAVLRDPEPAVIVDSLGESTVNLKFFAWLDQTTHDFLKVRSQAIRLVKEAFDASGIEMPEPIYRVLLRQSGGTAGSGTPGIPTPGRKSRTTDKAPEEDLAVDPTIDRQMRDEQRQSKEENLLPHSGTGL